MAAIKIMTIRHAERPPVDGSIEGVTPSGTKDPAELTVRGWQRAGALIRQRAAAGGLSRSRSFGVRSRRAESRGSPDPVACQPGLRGAKTLMPLSAIRWTSNSDVLR